MMDLAQAVKGLSEFAVFPDLDQHIDYAPTETTSWETLNVAKTTEYLEKNS